ncbi:MAG: protoglobin domain-containing protein [Isosphaeraceae bacterium]
MSHESLIERYRELQLYIGWTEEDAQTIRSIAGLLEPAFPRITDDFYEVIGRHGHTRAVLEASGAQNQRLKGTLTGWIGDLLSGNYDRDYVERRWAVGRRHAELGLDQAFCNVAMGRIREGLLEELCRVWDRQPAGLHRAIGALNRLLDLDLAIIEDAYQAERLERQRQVERLVTLGRLAGGIAHELRNPLSVIKTSVYYLRSAALASPAKTAEHHARIERQVELAERVILTLSNFASMPTPQRWPFSLAACWSEVLSQTSLPETIEVSLEGLEGLPPVVADSGQIQIVLSNLVRNAFEAMAGSGRLRITGKVDGPAVEIAVADSGTGIPPEIQSRIMEPFFTTKAKGLGLGLAISRLILENNEGSISVISQPGSGATFIVRLRAASLASSDPS